VPLHIPPLRERKEDIHLLFRKFSTDFADRYKMPPIKLTHDGEDALVNYYWKGNVRQLKNVTEQISVIEKKREIDAKTIAQYLPDNTAVTVPALFKPDGAVGAVNNEFTERELLYKVLFEMRKEMVDLKKVVLGLLENDGRRTSAQIIHQLHEELDKDNEGSIQIQPAPVKHKPTRDISQAAESPLSLEEKEKESIREALERHEGNRRAACKELGISERTMYRKIKEYNLDAL
jgi:DNA-binding NtrC family response regulator